MESVDLSSLVNMHLGAYRLVFVCVCVCVCVYVCVCVCLCREAEANKDNEDWNRIISWHLHPPKLLKESKVIKER